MIPTGLSRLIFWDGGGVNSLVSLLYPCPAPLCQRGRAAVSPSDQVLPSATSGAAFLSQKLLCLGKLGLLRWEDSGSQHTWKLAGCPACSSSCFLAGH